MSKAQFDITDYVIGHEAKGTVTPATVYTTADRMDYRELHHYASIGAISGAMTLQMLIQESKNGTSGWQTVWTDSAITVTANTKYLVVVQSRTLSLPSFRYFLIGHVAAVGTNFVLDFLSVAVGLPRAPMNGQHIIGASDPGTEGQGLHQVDANGNAKVRYHL